MRSPAFPDDSSVPLDLSEEFEETQPLNPLLISHIIKNVLSFSTFQDLKSIRLVSREWHHCASQMFQYKSKLRFHNYRHLDHFMSLQPSALPTSLIRNVCLFGRDFQDWVILLKPFFSKYGAHIKSLEISHGIGDVTEEFLLQIMQHVDSLHELTLSGSPGALYGSWANDGGFQFHPMLPSVSKLNLILPKTCFKHWASVKTFFIDFFSSFPNLKEITFLGHQLTEFFIYLPNELTFPMLQSIHLQLFNSEGLGHFTSRGFQLTRIELDIQPLISLQNLHFFIESFASSLKSLKVKFSYGGPYNYSHNATAFPSSRTLIKLEILELYGFWGNLYFLEDFCRLKEATVEKMLWEIAFPQGPQLLSKSKRRVIKFYDQNGIFHSLL